ncbi:Potassium efflux system KefA protein / Small-conductance mechanosensitive channel [Minicystis rosea]|nr:Potassium efflux system KefA protein / Small-conductance mechanosensitive channel [Minicystis rosea]
MRSRLLFVFVLAISVLAAKPAGAVDPKPVTIGSLVPPAPPAPPPVVDDATPDSPRASLRRFMGLCRAGEYGEAAAYLDLTEAQKHDGAQYARRLKAVIDAQIWIKLEQVSGKPWGDASDKLPAGVEEIGTVPGPNGPEPVRLVRKHLADGPRWLFSRNTVDHIDDWYGRLRDRWVRDYLPERLLRPGPQEMLWWQWIAFPVLFLLALGAGNVLGWCTRKALGRVVLRTKATWDDALLSRLGAPLTLLWAVVAVNLALPRLALYPPAEAFMGRIVQAGFYVAVLWFVERSIEIGGARLLDRPTTQTNPAARSLVPLGTRALKVAVFVVTIIATLSALGYPVGSLVAGLGIGGVAIALAAQKTVENLFGSLSIGVDQPFRVGDYITVDGLVSGTVESIGLRSTRIRTLDRTLVTIPNGKLADMRIESFTQRDRIKLGCTLQLERGTSAASVRAILEGTRALLKAHPRIWPDMNVALAKIGDDSLDIEILAWFQTTVWDDFLVMREDTLLGLLDIVEKAGAKLAYPTHAIRFESGAPPS